MEHSCSSQSAAAASATDGDQSTPTMQRLRQFRCFGITTVEAIAFWSAVALPVPTALVLAGGVSTLAELGFVTLLVVTNLAAFYIGHGYGSTTPQ
jgi:hypothetical protein